VQRVCARVWNEWWCERCGGGVRGGSGIGGSVRGGGGMGGGVRGVVVV